jgi:hypothetical protein
LASKISSETDQSVVHRLPLEMDEPHQRYSNLQYSEQNGSDFISLDQDQLKCVRREKIPSNELDKTLNNHLVQLHEVVDKLFDDLHPKSTLRAN